MKNKILILSGFLLFVFILFIVVYLNTRKVAQPSYPTPSFSNNTEEDYNNFRYLTPGKSTLSDIKKLNGEPLRNKTVGSEEYLYYRAPFGNLNPVLVKNNILIYANEHIFGNYRGGYSNFTNAYGNPDKIFYDKYGRSWMVFYKYGLAVQEGGGEIGQIIYFVPNNVALFYDTVAKDFGLSETPLGFM